ncbi:hypothetical protein [Volucribacter amazonae]|uniref:Uncharacterized protein n=1 Tax=Volucribacter amazonae TaxID=256731 RepID=A0A9X4PA74_9PAST|nr:hypothetical protein [Volucribacter amazonae]MDG6894547.1 hypothetical protein [Volucribacter amazonae]
MSKFIVNSFQVPNIVVDEFLGELTDEELKCYLYIMRWTGSSGRGYENIPSYRIMIDTGLNEADFKDALKRLIELGLIATPDNSKGA